MVHRCLVSGVPVKLIESGFGHPAAYAILSFAVFASVAIPSQAQHERPSALLEYQRLIKEGAQHNVRGDFKSAEAAYRRAMANCQAQFGEDASTCGNALSAWR